MKTITRRTATVLAAGALGLGGLAVAAPALAGNPFGGPAVTSTAVPGGNGFGMGSGYGMGGGHRDGTCMSAGLTAAQGTLTDAQKRTLASMAPEEKLAHDLYVAFAGRYDEAIFGHIAMSESQHLSMVRTVLRRYGIADPTVNQPPGTFTDPAVQSTYDKLLAQGEGGLSAALAAGQQVERDDIAALTAALSGLTAADVQQVYSRLLAASERHLAAFTR
ncbi:DUF2202 domain-containing protein [Actinoplanes sp. NPDC020271]|uniref:DUF2202 domain-containing protein n=1 Tax=Actinoplanes sp. NPDC020271 TaxID=3363896 RepID=UPI0037A19CD8